jgi:gas vesicle protein
MAEDRGSGIIYFLAGTALGALLGVLLAPRSGEQTRERLTDWLKERKDIGEDLLSQVKEESSIKKEAIIAAAKAAKQAYREATSEQRENDGFTTS